MATIKLPPYLKWRDGRPRWEPGPKLRGQGWKGRDLRRDDGGWMPLGEAIDAARALNDDVTAWRTRGGKQRTRPLSAKNPRTVRALYEKWRQSPRFAQLAASTVRDYESKANVFLATFGDEPLGALEPHHLYQWWEELYAERGHAMANGVVAVARALLSHARRVGWRQDNPAERLGLVTVAPRVVVWSPSEIECFARVGDAICPEVVDAVVVALDTGQRRGDVLELVFDKAAGGRCRFHQSKTGAPVTVPHTDQLAARLETIRARRAAKGGVVDLDTSRRVVLRADGRPYTGDAYSADFDRVRAAAAQEMPSIAKLRFQDLRDTAITRLALADCSVFEIRAISGHNLETVHQVLRHYIAIDDRMATSAIQKLKIYVEKQCNALRRQKSDVRP